MKIWQLSFDVDNYDNLRPKERWSIEQIQLFDGRNHAKGWKEITMVRLEPEKGLELGNAPGFYSHIPIVNKDVKKILEKEFLKEVELLPVGCDGEKFWIVNVTNILDCVDYMASEYKMFPDGKRILRFNKYSFREDKLVKNNIFKIKDELLKEPFVSDKFKKIIEENGFTGFKFRLVWNSEN